MSTINTPHKTNDGGPAFPHEGFKANYEIGKGLVQIPHIFSGMSLRDWFAGQALTGLIFHNDFGHVFTEDIAAGAYSYADAMLEARNKEVAP